MHGVHVGLDLTTPRSRTMIALALALSVGCALASLFASAVVRPILRAHGMVDRPNERSSHVVPTVRGGGAAFVLVILVALTLVARSTGDRAWMLIVPAAGTVAAVSFFDDLLGLGTQPRLLAHALAASVLVTMVLRDPPVESSLVLVVLAFVTFVGSVGYTNAFNFMDGIDAIASLHAILASFGSAAVLLASGAAADSLTVLAAFAIGASVLGFLPWNFPRARMFMGDVGSATLGYLLAAVLVRGVLERGLVVLAPLALLHSGFVLDTAITFGRRLARGERVSEAHREHFYQRLVRSGLAHPPVSILYASCTLVSVLCAVAIVGADAVTVTGAVFVVIVLWLAVFAFAEQRFNRAR